MSKIHKTIILPCVLYEYKSWSLTLRKEDSGCSGNMVLRRQTLFHAVKEVNSPEAILRPYVSSLLASEMINRFTEWSLLSVSCIFTSQLRRNWSACMTLCSLCYLSSSRTTGPHVVAEYSPYILWDLRLLRRWRFKSKFSLPWRHIVKW